MRKSRGILLVIISAILSSTVQSSAATSYAVTDLGPLFARGLNDRGDVVGDLNGRGVLRYADGRLLTLPLGSASAVNNWALVVGVGLGADGRRHALAWSEWDGMTHELDLFATPAAVGGNGIIVGSFLPVAPDIYPVRWGIAPWPQMERLGVPVGSFPPQASPLAVNWDGHAVGAGAVHHRSICTTRAVCLWAVRWPSSGGVERLGDLGGNYAVARGLNDWGVAVGWGITAAGETVPWAWNPGDGMFALPVAAPFTAGDAYAIDQGGSFVVGTQWYTDPQTGVQQRATLWDGDPRDLNTRVPPDPQRVLEVAVAINAAGQILARGTVGGQARSFLLTPLPPALAMTINGSTFASGQTLTVGLDVQNPGTAELYFGLFLPQGQLLLLSKLSPLESVMTTIDRPETFRPITPTPVGSIPDYWRYTFNGGEPYGTYHLVAALVPSGAFADGRIDDGDILASDWKTFQVNGGSGLQAKMQAIRARHVAQASSSLGNTE